jgi:hypothetical protein
MPLPQILSHTVVTVSSSSSAPTDNVLSAINVPDGAMIILAAANSPQTTDWTVTDTAGNFYANALDLNVGSVRLKCIYTANSPGNSANVITARVPTSTNSSFPLYVIVLTNASNGFDLAPINSGAFAQSQSVLTRIANDLILVFGNYTTAEPSTTLLGNAVFLDKDSGNTSFAAVDSSSGVNPGTYTEGYSNGAATNAVFAIAIPPQGVNLPTGVDRDNAGFNQSTATVTCGATALGKFRGDTVLVGAYTTHSVMSVQDSQGNNYQLLGTMKDPSGASTLYVYANFNTPVGAATVSVTFSTGDSTNNLAWALDITGTQPTSGISISTANGNNADPTITLKTVTTFDMPIAFFGAVAAGALIEAGPDSGVLYDQIDIGTTPDFAFEYWLTEFQVPSQPSSTLPNTLQGGAADWVAIGINFDAIPSPPSGPSTTTIPGPFLSALAIPLCGIPFMNMTIPVVLILPIPMWQIVLPPPFAPFPLPAIVNNAYG